MNCGFIALPVLKEALTVLVLHLPSSRAIRVVWGKGRADAIAVSWTVDQLMRLMLSQCVLKADGELEQRTFVKDMLEEAANKTRLCVASAHSPSYDHKRMARSERLVRSRVRVGARVARDEGRGGHQRRAGGLRRGGPLSA